MTAKGMWEAVLIELNKLEAPSILLEDFNYLANKAVNQYINRKYNVYDVNLQSTDDLRVLKASAILDVLKSYSDDEDSIYSKDIYGATYVVNLPDDYLHMLNCICIYKLNDNLNYKCYDSGTLVKFGATRLTADMWGQIINNFYMRPSYKRPYYYIEHINTSSEAPYNKYSETLDNTNMQQFKEYGTDVDAYETTTSSSSLSSSSKLVLITYGDDATTYSTKLISTDEYDDYNYKFILPNPNTGNYYNKIIISGLTISKLGIYLTLTGVQEIVASNPSGILCTLSGSTAIIQLNVGSLPGNSNGISAFGTIYVKI